MQLRGLAPTTQRSYTHYVAEFAKFYHASPEHLDLAAIRQYELHLLHEKKLSPESINAFVSAVQFLYLPTLEMPWGKEQGHTQNWRGYKQHIDVADGQIPISCVLTSASLHDSQAAIPLATITNQRVTSLYEVMVSGLPVEVCFANMDAAYDAKEIREHCESLGHVSLIDPVQKAVPIVHRTSQDSLRGYDKRRKLPQTMPRKIPRFTTAQEERYKIRTMSERVNARLKDEFGGRTTRVRGASKVMAHLVFGILALTVDQLLRLAG